MRLARHDDPWEKDKNIPDPWDSPRYRQWEKQLQRRIGLEEDCAFSIAKHHTAAPASPRTAPPRAAQSRGGSAKKSGVSAVSGFIGVLFVIIQLYSLASVLPLVAATGLVAGGILYWVQNYAFLLIVLAVLFFAFRRAGRKG